MARAVRLRMCQEDRDQYGGPESTVYDEARIMDQPSGVIEDWENELGYGLIDVFVDFDRRRARAIRAALWLSRRLEGVNEPYAEFQPRVLRIHAEQAPPADGGDGAGNPEPPAKTSRAKKTAESAVNSAS